MTANLFNGVRAWLRHGEGFSVESQGIPPKPASSRRVPRTRTTVFFTEREHSIHQLPKTIPGTGASYDYIHPVYFVVGGFTLAQLSLDLRYLQCPLSVEAAFR